MWIAREGMREMWLGTIVLGAGAGVAGWLFWPLALPFVLVWLWVIAFFRDPPRRITCAADELCSPADGTITEITHLDNEPLIGGPAVRIGMFLSIFNVHINRAPCAGRVRSITYMPGAFLDARDPDSGKRNESNTIILDTEAPLPGPVVVRQVAGKVARRIICHLSPGDRVTAGQRFGLIKFGSRTELLVPRLAGTKVLVGIGDRVRAGLTILARQSANERPE